MNSRLLRALLLGNLIVYAAVGLLLAYFSLFPSGNTIAAASDLENAGAFLSLVIPTPTEIAMPDIADSITPIAIDTPLPTVDPILLASATPTPTAPPIPTVVPVKDRGLVPPSALNILLMGTDRRPGQSNWRTDTLILLSVNQAEKTVGLLTIPRDLWVRIPGIGQHRINTADFYGEYYHLPGGGPATIKRTIELNLGIRVHYYARVGFEGFRKSVDTLGGIDVDVDCALREGGFYDDFGRVDLNFQPGVQHMDGVTALRYARSRYTTNDYDRGRRQRKVLLAMWDQALSLNLLPKWPELYSQFQNSVQTDLGPVEMAALAYIGSRLQMDKIKSRAIDNRVTSSWISPNGEWVLLPNPERIHSLLVEFFSSAPPELDAVALEKARIEILSANKETADLAATNLRRQGLAIAEVKQVTPLAATSSIQVFGSKPATVQRLTELLRLNPKSIQNVTDADDNYDIRVTLGRDYNPCQR